VINRNIICRINIAIALNKEKTINWKSVMRPSIQKMNDVIEHCKPDSDGIL